MANTLTQFETAILEAYLVGNWPGMRLLREQLSAVEVMSREYSKVGFFVDLKVPCLPSSQFSKVECQMGDVEIHLPGLSLGLGTILFVKNGTLNLLEGFTYGEDWGGETAQFAITYKNQDVRRDEAAIPSILKKQCFS